MMPIFLSGLKEGQSGIYSITGHGFPANWLPDQLLDEMRLWRDKSYLAITQPVRIRI